MIPIEFIEQWESIQEGEIRTFTKEVAEEHVQAGRAKYVETTKKKTKSKKKDDKKQSYRNVAKVLKEELLTDPEAETDEGQPPHHTLKNEEQTDEQKIDRLSWEALQWYADKKMDMATECLVKAIKLKYHLIVITDDRSKTKEIYVYEDGIYVPRGRSSISMFIRSVMGRAHSTHVKNAVLVKIEDDPKLNILPEDFFAAPPTHLIPLNNGIYNRETKQLEDYSPDIILRAKVPVTYDPNAECPKFLKFLSEILPDPADQKTMLQLFGYLLLPDYRFQKAVMMLGGGSNGKTVLLEIMTHFLGEQNVSGVDLHALMEDQYSIANLLGKLANLAGDIGNEPIDNSQVIKKLTGRDQISANRKHLTHVEFINYAKLIFACNNLPDSYDDSDGFWRRWLFFEFPNKFWKQERIDNAHPAELQNVFLRDPEIQAKICTEQEMSGLLNKAIEALEELIENRGFDDKQGVRKLRIQWRRKSNSFFAFLQDELEMAFDYMVEEEQLQQAYTAYCVGHNIAPVSRKQMEIMLRQHGGNRTRKMVQGERDYYWTNIRFRHGIVMLDNISKLTDLSRFSNDRLNTKQDQNQHLTQLPQLPRNSENNNERLREENFSENFGNSDNSVRSQAEALKPSNSSNTGVLPLRPTFFINVLKEIEAEKGKNVNHEEWVEEVKKHHKKMIDDWKEPKDFEEQAEKIINQLFTDGEIASHKPGRWSIL